MSEEVSEGGCVWNHELLEMFTVGGFFFLFFKDMTLLH